MRPCVEMGAVQSCALCSTGCSVALGAVQRWTQCSDTKFGAACSICAVLKANVNTHTFESAWSRCYTGSASLNAAHYPRLPLRSASPAAASTERDIVGCWVSKMLGSVNFCAFYSPPRGSWGLQNPSGLGFARRRTDDLLIPPSPP